MFCQIPVKKLRLQLVLLMKQSSKQKHSVTDDRESAGKHNLEASVGKHWNPSGGKRGKARETSSC